MDTDSIDASIGLEFSLELFKEYKASGRLQAKLLRVPGIQKNSVASLQLVEGAVVACFIEERNGQRLQVAKAMLIQIDNERGPFEWQFHRAVPPASSPPVMPTASLPPAAPLPANPYTSQRLLYLVPRAVARLNWIQLRSWSYEQRQAVYLVWQLIDGKRSVQEIQATLSSQLVPATINEVLQVLLDMKVVTMQS